MQTLEEPPSTKLTRSEFRDKMRKMIKVIQPEPRRDEIRKVNNGKQSSLP